jgi:hypothetical protein
MKKILAFLEFSKAVPGLQKIHCSQLEQNDPCSRPEYYSKLDSKVVYP